MTAAAATRMGRRFRRFSGLVVLLAALGLLGGMYTAFAHTAFGSSTPTQVQADDAATVQAGQRLFSEGCVSCHGMNAQGVPGRGPSLIGVGAAAVEFQVSTGRMPAARQEAQADRKPPQYNEEQTRQLAAFIQSLGGGPQVPEGSLRNDEAVAEGGRLFRINCASCHAFGMNGAPLSSGKYAPGLNEATDREMYAAMLTGPQSMPVFGDNELTPDQKKALISYIQSQNSDPDPGGFGIGRTGPVPEGLVIFLVGIGVLLITTLWIAGKS